jgi:hypothetical protein
MDTLPTGDLNDLERRLTEMRPSGEGLDADKMLFAAGRNSVRGGWSRVAWPLISGSLALTTLALAFGMFHERSERRDLIAKLENQTPAQSGPKPALGTSDVPSSEPPAANSYIVTRKVLSQSVDSWPAPSIGEPPDNPPPSRAILSAHSLGDFLDQ